MDVAAHLPFKPDWFALRSLNPHLLIPVFLQNTTRLLDSSSTTSSRAAETIHHILDLLILLQEVHRFTILY
jgi:hypothetical protein